jgi:para-nitrobenzyl esterase
VKANPRKPFSKSLHLFVVLFLVSCFCCVVAALPSNNEPIVKTGSGKLRGVLRPSGGAEFLGIPYAQPPVGPLRWHEAVPVGKWRDVRDATSFGAPCAQPVLGDWNQHDAETSKEDCLFLNVITPVWPPKAPLPVMFWLHGGGNEGGTASSALYKDGTLVKHGVLLVTVNYRLGVFGFFAHPGLTRESEHHASGNYGLMDQIAALQWVRANISKFGGDPANITVFGQSAGAQDTSLLMASALSKSLFHRAIAESGAAINPTMPSLSQSEQAGEKLAAKLNAPAGNDAIKFLRQLSVDDLMKAASNRTPNEPPPIGPNIDGWVIAGPPAEVFAEGQQASVPLILGTTTREFGSSSSPDELRKWIEKVTGSFAPRALSLYGLADNGQGTSDPMYGSAADQWFADLIFRCPVATEAQFHNAAHHPTYQYELQHAIPGQESQGAVHSADLPYVFGFYPKSGNISGNFTDTDFKLAELIETYWTNFAKTGNPNGGTLPNWPEFNGSQAYIAFTQDGRVVPTSGGLRRPPCDLLRDVLKQRMSDSQ